MSKDLTLFNADSVQFVMLSFEGPDRFSMAGGLGIRATEICTCLASMGYETHLYFIGDPNLPSQELFKGVHLHRWSQWLSYTNPGGCYMAEGAKVEDMATSLPSVLITEVIIPAAKKGKLTIILAEEWQTVPTVLSLRSLLEETELSGEAIILWNANNTYGFKGINWNDLQNACSITTVSRYMKHLMWQRFLNPVVIHNGIPSRILNPVEEEDKERLKEIFPDLLISKVGRYDADKRWIMAIKSIGLLKKQGLKPTLLARGGSEFHRCEVRAEAERQGLSWQEIYLPDKSSKEEIFTELEKHKDADVLELCFFVPEDFINIMYAGSDCVLANSGHEPFGLVGLEVMACGGLVFVGATGEDYAQTMNNSIVVETEDELEIVEYIHTLIQDDSLREKIKREARRSASDYVWENIMLDLFQKIRFIAASKGICIR